MITGARLAADFRRLGVEAGQTLLVHASMRNVGRVAGGASTVVAALRDVLGPMGTLVVPAFTTGNSDTSKVFRNATRGMSPTETSAFRSLMPAFDARTTPSEGMGIIAETVRLTPGSVRSAHPQTSYAAIGARAADLMKGHAPDCHHGERSPLARLYEVGAHVMLLGVGFDRCTAFHLAEYRYLFPHTPTRVYRCVVNDGYGRKWWEFSDAVLDDSEFAQVGADFRQTGATREERTGQAHTVFFPLSTAVDHAVRWLRERRVPKSSELVRQDSVGVPFL
ncbi:AAC(3) family N-acetyltransferase [Herbidospora galbida]|uniref:Aminoglycoside N(3)-acetyltransferase n=1 Tax=Herbidospora galbida TaxID=2575442 RepID=A0A4U3ML97_9ACTN|nr:AAC(3) family N-acetyltransferase [Herbidospora galbida]TKK89314.1 AAC(3) family N-acetyltransferase [Herbidospora galbida]